MEAELSASNSGLWLLVALFAQICPPKRRYNAQVLGEVMCPSGLWEGSHPQTARG